MLLLSVCVCMVQTSEQVHGIIVSMPLVFFKKKCQCATQQGIYDQYSGFYLLPKTCLVR
jgi:hypothetical protein